jgi:hypothetical protein
MSQQTNPFKFLSLEDIKRQSRIDGNAEDAILTMYGQSAETTLAGYLGYMDDHNHPDVDSMLADFDNNLPKPLYQASLMLVDTWYQHRTPDAVQNMSVVPYSFDILVKQYVKL